MYSCVQAFAGCEHAAGGEEELAENSHEHEHSHGHDVLRQQRRIYEHTDGNEEDSTKKIFYRRNELFDAFCFRSFSNERAHDERAECRGEAELGGYYDHAEAEADRNNDDGFIIHKLACPFEKAGDEVHAEYKPEHEEEDEARDAHYEFHGRDAAAGDGERGEQDHHGDTGDVFHDEYAEDCFREVCVAQL